VTAELEPLARVLARHGLEGVREEPFPNDGWSGATMTLLRRGDGERFVLKRDSPALDWIATATHDGPILREAWFAGRGLALPSPIRAPYLGAGRDGADFGILMPDLTGVLFDWDAPISVEELDRVLSGLAALHAYPWRTSGEIEDGPWCPIRERITLICRASLERPGAARDAVGARILPGWDAFDRRAPRAVREIIGSLGANPQPLVDALATMPSTLIHGDLKLANVGIEPDGSVDLVDWQMVSLAPVAIELGWFLVSNVASLPLQPADVVARYHDALRQLVPGGAAIAGQWDAQVDAAILVGLLLRGWRKGADAEARVTLASGVTAADDLAWWSERAVAAANRLL
jgi:phosphotransferase family enzyme